MKVYVMIVRLISGASGPAVRHEGEEPDAERARRRGQEHHGDYLRPHHS